GVCGRQAQRRRAGRATTLDRRPRRRRVGGDAALEGGRALPGWSARAAAPRWENPLRGAGAPRGPPDREGDPRTQGREIRGSPWRRGARSLPPRGQGNRRRPAPRSVSGRVRTSTVDVPPEVFAVRHGGRCRYGPARTG